VFLAPQNAQINSQKWHKLTLEVLKVNIFMFKMQNDLIWAYNQMAKSRPHCRKKPKIDLWEITGCVQIQEIERPEGREQFWQKKAFCFIAKKSINK
jgi:hypothetical protein